MKWYYGAGGRYNERFARAVVKARLSGRDKFRFRGNTYIVTDHIGGVMDDLEEGRYSIVLGNCRHFTADR